jgi:hypothetical protein
MELGAATLRGRARGATMSETSNGPVDAFFTAVRLPDLPSVEAGRFWRFKAADRCDFLAILFLMRGLFFDLDFRGDDLLGLTAFFCH